MTYVLPLDRILTDLLINFGYASVGNSQEQHVACFYQRTHIGERFRSSKLRCFFSRLSVAAVVACNLNTVAAFCAVCAAFAAEEFTQCKSYLACSYKSCFQSITSSLQKGDVVPFPGSSVRPNIGPGIIRGTVSDVEYRPSHREYNPPPIICKYFFAVVVYMQRQQLP